MPLVIAGKTAFRGPLVKRLRLRPLTPASGVRFPYGSPETVFDGREKIRVNSKDEITRAQLALFNFIHGDFIFLVDFHILLWYHIFGLVRCFANTFPL